MTVATTIKQPVAQDADLEQLARQLANKDQTKPAIVKQAVLYLRVSTPGQVHTDYDPEGISLPAQRKACERKAEQLGLKVVGEYVEAGVSGRDTEHRMEFQKMLARIKTNKDVDYVIVHKLSRLARNRIDEALIMDQFNRRNVTLVSSTEPIDNTPEGQFMQGILSAMAQFRSRQDGEDIAYKMGEKAKNGGTIGKAPVGYLNTHEIVDGHEVSTVIIDTERAPYIKTMFELYRNGATLRQICTELTARGLVIQGNRKHAAGPITDSTVAYLLRDPYYLGFVTYKG
jgi:site-specific DNA recombinase